MQIRKVNDVRNSIDQIWNTYDKKTARHVSQFVSQSFILFSKTLLDVLHNMSLTVLLPWKHSGFQIFSILKNFLATSGVPF